MPWCCGKEWSMLGSGTILILTCWPEAWISGKCVTVRTILIWSVDFLLLIQTHTFVNIWLAGVQALWVITVPMDFRLKTCYNVERFFQEFLLWKWKEVNVAKLWGKNCLTARLENCQSETTQIFVVVLITKIRGKSCCCDRRVAWNQHETKVTKAKYKNFNGETAIVL